MSNLQYPMALSAVVSPEVDWQHKETYLVQKSSVENAYWQQITLSNYSDSLLNFKIQLSNSENTILDRVISLLCPIRFDITGSRTSGLPLLQEGQFAVRSNGLSKAINQAQINLASTGAISIPSDTGIIVSALEQSSPLGIMKSSETFDAVTFDQACDYDSLVGSARNPLSLYRNSFGSYIPRGAYDVEILSNTPSSASILVNFNLAIFLTPLISTFSAKYGSASFARMDNVVLNLQLVGLATRCLSFCRDALGDRLTITNIAPILGPNTPLSPPVASVKTFNVIDQTIIPSVCNYPTHLIDRYSLQFGLAPRDGFVNVTGPAVSLDTVPSYVLVYACHPQSNYLSQSLLLNDNSVVHGSQLTDTFCAIQSVQVQVQGRTAMNVSNPQTLYKMCVENGSELSYPSFTGVNMLNGLAPVAYTRGVGTVLKMSFDNDIKIWAGKDIISPGAGYKFQYQCTIGVKNIYTLTNDQLALYYVFVYPSITQATGVNQVKLVQTPLSTQDCLNASRQVATAHYAMSVDHDMYGFGMHGKMHKHITSNRHMHHHKRSRMIRHHLKELHDKFAPSGMGHSGGARKSRKSRKSGKGKSKSKSRSRKGGARKKSASRKSSLRFY